MKLFIIASALLMSSVSAADHSIRGLAKGGSGGDDKPVKPTKGPTLKKGSTTRPTTPKCTKTPSSGFDNSERLLVREGVISALPKSLCDPTRPGQKNVILVVGDGMGWEMVRAGAIAKLVLNELSEMGVNAKIGASGTIASAAKAAFKGRSLNNYYTEGKGSGLSFQTLENFALVTTSTPLLQMPNAGNHYGPTTSLLKGSVTSHDDGLSPLALNACGEIIDFNPTDYEKQGGNMVLWDPVKGGTFPWDSNYYTDTPNITSGFDPEYIMRHATDSANTAGSLATGEKASVNMLSVDLYEEKKTTIVEDATMCGKAGGVVSSVPVLHATPGAFITHSNNRNNGPQLQRNFRINNPSYVSGTCSSFYQPSQDNKMAMLNGSLSEQWTFLSQKETVLAKDFYNSIQNLDPDDDQHVLVCLAGDYTASNKNQNLPWRGVDSSYSDRWCSTGVEIKDPTNPNITVKVSATTDEVLCDHYTEAELKNIPLISTNVKEALKFLGKDKDGFFMMYEQGDIDWAAHANHMDDMLGAMLDIDESVQAIIDWIEANGGWERNALYVTADHDHYLTLNNHFPEALANLIIDGKSAHITPRNNSQVNPWDVGVKQGRHINSTKSVTANIKDFTTWTAQDIEMVAHYWGARGSGGNGWGSHSTRPVPLHYAGDNGCIEKLTGKGYRVAGKEVKGQPGYIDQVHIHACMMKSLFGLS